ncbi:hypothetical protein JKV55_09675 [Zobellella sp. CGMCC 1.18722]|uniref:Uncharacterized protein n=1 Tax=Zobellella iuensis TaxID=2803811 RepID=A0ABS1QST1_9GAMM|nr:hypothetical protein [Zobellella iuensis]MBL1377597.1 hypothetical protein [Zobellella iuensis]
MAAGIEQHRQLAAGAGEQAKGDFIDPAMVLQGGQDLRQVENPAGRPQQPLDGLTVQLPLRVIEPAAELGIGVEDAALLVQLEQAAGKIIGVGEGVLRQRPAPAAGRR